jgi:hypothetical protein
MSKVIINLEGASSELLNNLIDRMDTRSQEIYHLGSEAPMIKVTKEELKDYIFLLENV